jgi:hypothetical protein
MLYLGMGQKPVWWPVLTIYNLYIHTTGTVTVCTGITCRKMNVRNTKSQYPTWASTREGMHRLLIWPDTGIQLIHTPDIRWGRIPDIRSNFRLKIQMSSKMICYAKPAFNESKTHSFSLRVGQEPVREPVLLTSCLFHQQPNKFIIHRHHLLGVPALWP